MLQLDANMPVAIYGEGTEHAMAIGFTKMSTEEVGAACVPQLEWWLSLALWIGLGCILVVIVAHAQCFVRQSVPRLFLWLGLLSLLSN